MSLLSTIKKLIVFNEPKKQEGFILKSTDDKEKNKSKKANTDAIEKQIKAKEAEKAKEPEPSDTISDNYEESLRYMKDVYSIPLNSDIVLREFIIKYKEKPVKAFIIFFDGMTDTDMINDFILQPLMVSSELNIDDSTDSLEEFISQQLLPHGQVNIVKSYRKVIDEINYGGCGLFANGVAVGFVSDVKGWEHRGVEKPNNELVIKGSQEAFNEQLRTNTAHLRRRIKDENLIAEDIKIGKKSKTPCNIIYIKSVANDMLVGEVRRRLSSINVDYLLDTGVLEQLIEDSTFFPAPQILSTERPDYVSEMLINGRVAIIVAGSPNVLVVPITAYELLHSVEDEYIRFPYANLLRIIRIIAVIIALLLPGIYIAITNYHQEMIPTDLLLAIEASWEKVPFQSVVELIIMEISFELIREAGIRVPGPIGPTLSIVGALILGQAAVEANVVSPILIIVVAITGIGSFAIPSYPMGYSIRIMRFVFIFLGTIAGFLGITFGLFLLGIWSTSVKSFGVPYMSPIGPKTSNNLFKVIFRAPEWKMEYRPDYLNAKKVKKQDKYSMGWKKDKKR